MSDDKNTTKDTVDVPVVRVVVTRNTGEQIGVDVPEHEIMLLQAIHGEQSVIPVEDGTELDDAELPDNITLEMIRLRNKYPSAELDLVGAVMQGGTELKQFGFHAPKLGDKVQHAPQSSQTVHKVAKKAK